MLSVVTVFGLAAPYWPSVHRNDIEIGLEVGGDFTVGFWVDWGGGACEFYCAADETGFVGHPWTCIAPGLGYATGWHHPIVVHPGCRSLGIGATVTDPPTRAECRTWGTIKQLYR